MKIKRNKTFRAINRVLSLLLMICMTLPTISISIYSAGDVTTQTDAADDTTVGAGAAEGSEGEAQQPEKEVVGVVFAKSTIRKGAKFTKSNVEVIEIDKARVPKGAMTDANDVIGKVSLMQIAAGEYIYDGAVAKKKTDGTTVNTTYINVANFINPSTGEDLTQEIQALIEKYPKRTLYFPDGEYIISKSLRTYGDPQKTVSFLLADGAVIKAADNWVTENDCDCLIASGVYDSFNAALSETGPLSDVVTSGSYFWIQGGTLDGNGKAGGISLDGGRETLVKNVVIKNVPLGIHVNIGVNNKSADMDIDDVIIDCNGIANSVGIKVRGYDNTFTNIRIYNANKGITFPKYNFTDNQGTTLTNVYSGGNAFRNIHIIYNKGKGSIAIDEGTHPNFYYHCYVENYATAYRLYGQRNIIDACTAKNCSTGITSQVSSSNNTASACRVTNGSANKYGWADHIIKN